jgi:hypothetical protein
MATTEALTKGGAAVEAYTSGIPDGGNVTIMEMKNRGDNTPVNYAESLENNFADIGDFEVLRRIVKHEVDLITFATDNDLTLTRTEVDGSSASVLRAES